MTENIQFFLIVVVAHVFTYTICGVIAMNLFKYMKWVKTQETWRSPDSPIMTLAIPIQIIRGILYGIVFLLIKDTVVYADYGIIKTFVIIVILGLFNTPAPSPGSVEGFIYLKPTKEPLRVAIGGMSEILIQNLLFCIIVCTKWIDLFGAENVTIVLIILGIFSLLFCLMSVIGYYYIKRKKWKT
jgi:hypothetical protein